MSRLRLARGGWDEPPIEPPTYGFMEPAFQPVISRRQATPAELAAARGRETPENAAKPKGYLIVDTAATQASRIRGAAISHAHKASARPAGPERSAKHGGAQMPGAARARDARAVRVMAAMRECRDDMDRVAVSLGMQKNAVAIIVKHARLRA